MCFFITSCSSNEVRARFLRADGWLERQFVEEGGVVAVETEFFDVIDFAGCAVKWISGCHLDVAVNYVIKITGEDED